MSDLRSPSTVIFDGVTTNVDTTAKHQLGTIAQDENGYEYIYLQGVASTAAGDFVTYDEAYLTTRLAANGVGPVGVAQAATIASTYGWYLKKGKYATANIATGSTDNKPLFATSTAGRAAITAVVGDLICNAIARGDAASNVGVVQVENAFVTDVVPAA